MKATIVDAYTTRLKVGDTVTFPESNLRGRWTVIAVHDFGTIDVTQDELIQIDDACSACQAQKFYRVTGLNPAINH